MDSNIEGFALPGGEPLLAGGAFQADSAVERVLLQHRFDPLCEAWLTDVVHRLLPLRDFVARNYAGVALKSKSPVGDLDQRVSSALGNLLLQFSQAVCHAEVVLLEGMQLGVVREETVLCLEQLVVDLTHRQSKLIEVSKPDSGFPNVPGCGDCGRCNGDKAVVHG